MTIKSKQIPHVTAVGMESSATLGKASINSPCPGIIAGMISEPIIIRTFLIHFFVGLVLITAQKNE